MNLGRALYLIGLTALTVALGFQITPAFGALGFFTGAAAYWLITEG